MLEILAPGIIVGASVIGGSLIMRSRKSVNEQILENQQVAGFCRSANVAAGVGDNMLDSQADATKGVTA